MNRKSANTNSAPDSNRCTHRTPSGRRCKMPVVSPGQPLCGTHTEELIKADGLNLREALIANSHDFQTAQGINFTLGAIFKLLAANYISARRASVLTFICSQLLRTLPAIDADNAAGIKGPIAPQPGPPATPPMAPITNPSPTPAASKPDVALAPKSGAQPTEAASPDPPKPAAQSRGASTKPASPITAPPSGTASPSRQPEAAPFAVAPPASKSAAEPSAAPTLADTGTNPAPAKGPTSRDRDNPG